METLKPMLPMKLYLIVVFAGLLSLAATLSMYIMIGSANNFGQDMIPPAASSPELSEYEQIEEDTPLVCIDPGHGGKQPGAVYEGVYEKDLTLEISLKLRDYLEDAGVRTIMTRESDEHIDLEGRVSVANEADSDLFVSIHCNVVENSRSTNGLESYYYKGSKVGKAFSDTVLKACSDAGITTRYSREQEFYVTHYTAMPAILVETGYMTNHEELLKLQSEEYQDKLAKAICQGILNYIEATTDN